VKKSHTPFEHACTPTVILVHGPFTDASSWTAVIRELQTVDIDVIAPAVPLRGLAHDADYIASVADQSDGPVLLVGHSYGGAVATVVGALAPNVVGLVYISAFALDIGESVLDATRLYPDTLLAQALRPAEFRDQNDAPAADLYLKLDAFHTIFAADMPAAEAAVAAVSQRPVAAAALDEAAPAAGWKTLPTWYLVTTGDRVIHPETQRFMARRAQAKTLEVDASHSVVRSQPTLVAELIGNAARASRRSA
jgi:pimeloyl-ACP methyl ester carboxylesterase